MMGIAKVVIKMDDSNTVSFKPDVFKLKDPVTTYYNQYDGIYTKEQINKALTIAKFILSSKF